MNADDLSLTFSKPVFTKILNLSSCSITELKENFLWQFPKLRYLDLSNNKLSEINLNLSLSFPDVSGLNISNNNLIALNDSFTTQLDTLIAANKSVSINIDNNPFRCDCDTVPFIRWFQSIRVTIENKMAITCSYRGLATKLILYVSNDELGNDCLFDSSTHLVQITVIIVIVLVFVGILVGVIVFKYRWHIRWHWYVTKQLFTMKQQVNMEGYNEQKEFLCLISHIGINEEGIIKMR